GRFAPGNRLGKQFEPGNQCGKGNPSFRKLAANRRAFLDAVTPDEVRELARRLYQHAMMGDKEAAKLVLAYAVGRPGVAADPDARALEEWRLAARPPGAELALAAILGHMSPAEAIFRVREGYQTAGLRALLDEFLGKADG